MYIYVKPHGQIKVPSPLLSWPTIWTHLGPVLWPQFTLPCCFYPKSTKYEYIYYM